MVHSNICFFVFLWLFQLQKGESFAETPCSWQVEVMNSDSVVTVSSLVQDTLPVLSVTESISSWYSANLKDIQASQGGFQRSPYVLGISIYCNGEILPEAARMFAMSGGKPVVTLEADRNVLHDKLFGQVLHIFEPILVDKNHLTGGASYSVEDLLWLVPFPMDHYSFSYKCTIENGVTSLLPEKESHYITLTGLLDTNAARPAVLGSTVSNAVSPPVSGYFPITMIPGLTPTAAIVTIQSPTTPTYVLSDDFFETYSTLQASALTGTDQCGCSGALAPPNDMRIVSLPDRLLFVSTKGISEVLANVTQSSGGHPSSFTMLPVYTGCARHLEVSQQSEAPQHLTVLLLGGCTNFNKVATASYTPRKGPGLTFREVLNTADQTLCDVVGSAGDCSIVAATIMASSNAAFIALVKQTVSDVYSIWSYGSTSTWVEKSVLPSMITSTPSTTPYLVANGIEAGDVALTLTGISVPKFISNSIFLFGNRLLVSTDAGQNFYLMEDFVGASNIVQIVSSKEGWFAFLTDTREVWVGTVGRFSLSLIYPSAAWDVVHWESEALAPETSTGTTVVSLFFDLDEQLQFLVVPGGGSTSLARVNARLEEVLRYVTSMKEWEKDNVATSITIEDLDMCGSPPDPCPFIDILYELPRVSWYTKEQRSRYSPPVPGSEVGLQSVKAVSLYQAVVRSTHLTEERFDRSSYLQSQEDPIKLWQGGISKDEELQEYLFKNGYTEADVYIHTEGYGLETEAGNGSFFVSELPDLIYLNKGKNFTVSVYVVLNISKSMDRGEVDNVRVTVGTTDSSLLAARISSTYIPLDTTKLFTVELVEQGGGLTQRAPGKDLVPVSVSFSVFGAATQCFNQEDRKTKQKGVHEMTVMLGCPPTQKAVFDFFSAKKMAEAAGDETFDCYLPDPSLPCFYFSNGFYPVFQVIDSATGERNVWDGNYTLRVVGGGPTAAETSRYSDQDIFRYNSLTSGEAALIMSPMLDSFTDDDGWVIYNVNKNDISWFCQVKSPCSLIFPNLPNNSEYFFLMEFSNRGVDNSSHCDYTMEFLLHVHGLPINDVSFTISLVLAAALVICIWFGLFFFNMKKGALIRAYLGDWFRRKFKVHPETIEREFTNEELEEMAEKNWRQALKIRMDAVKISSILSTSVEPSDMYLGEPAVTVEGKTTKPGQIPDRGRRMSVADALDGRISMVSSINHGELMRLRTLNRAFISRQDEVEEEEEEDEQ